MKHKKKILLLASFLVVLFLAPFASSWPDGLERVAEDLGFADAAREFALPALLPDYTVPGLPWEKLGTVIAGIVGVALVYGFLQLLAKFLWRADGVARGR
ncbi:MAG: cobalt/nickel transport protein [Clostridia bacterium]|nr:cobalt/nickel transport protein [Clostridia bacterium]